MTDLTNSDAWNRSPHREEGTEQRKSGPKLSTRSAYGNGLDVVKVLPDKLPSIKGTQSALKMAYSSKSISHADK